MNRVENRACVLTRISCAVLRLKELIQLRLDAQGADEAEFFKLCAEERALKEEIRPLCVKAWLPELGTLSDHYEALQKELDELYEKHLHIVDDMEGHRDDEDVQSYYEDVWMKEDALNTERAEQVRQEIKILSERHVFDI